MSMAATKTAGELFRGLTAMKNEVTETYDRLRAQVSEADRKVGVIYHRIENEDFRANEGFVLAKELKHALKWRRKVKMEFAEIHSIYHMLTNTFDETRSAYETVVKRHADWAAGKFTK